MSSPAFTPAFEKCDGTFNERDVRRSDTHFVLIPRDSDQQVIYNHEPRILEDRYLAFLFRVPLSSLNTWDDLLHCRCIHQLFSACD